MTNPPPLPSRSHRDRKVPFARLLVAATAIGVLASGVVAGWWLTGRSGAPLVWRQIEERVAQALAATVGHELGAIAPIRYPDSSLTSEHIRPEVMGWIEERWEREGRSESEKAFIRKCLEKECYAPGNLSRDEMNLEAQILIEELDFKPSDDPIVEWMLGRHLSNDKERRKRLDRAIQMLADEEGDLLLALHATADHCWSIQRTLSKDTLPEYEAACDRAMEMLGRMLIGEADTFPKVSPQIAAYMLLVDSGTNVRKSDLRRLATIRHEEFSDIVATSQAVPEWLRHWVREIHHTRAAWKARGGDYAHTVTPQGWKVFKAELKLAQQAAEASWAAGSAHPGPAADAITVAMGLGEGMGEMRKWFDRAVGAQIDYGRAYQAFRGGLLPRWGGSHELLAEFADECLAVGRFDTAQPWEYLFTHSQIATDQKKSQKEYFSGWSDFSPFETLMEGFAANPDREPWLISDMSTAACFFYMNDQHELADRALRRIDYQLNFETPKRVGIENPEWMKGDIKARLGPAAHLLLEGEDAEERRQAEKALNAYAAALEIDGVDPQAQAYFRHRKEILEMGKAFSEGVTLDFLPDPKGAGWKSAAYKSSRLEWVSKENALVWPGRGYGLVFAEAGLGGDFEIWGKFRTTGLESKGLTGWGVVYGDPDWDGSNWGSVRFEYDGEQAILRLGRTLRRDVEAPAEFGESCQFRIVVQDGKIDVEINDERVQEGALIDEKLELGEGSKIGFLGMSNMPAASIELTELKLKKR